MEPVEIRPKEYAGVNLSEAYDYLSDLRESGETNMFGSPEWLKDHFNIQLDDAVQIFHWWMEDFK